MRFTVSTRVAINHMMGVNNTLDCSMSDRWEHLNSQIAACDRCPRLRYHCADIAVIRRKSFASETYWGKPVPNFGVAPAGLSW